MKAPAYQSRFEIGAPPDTKTPSAFIDATEFIVFSQLYTAEELGEIMCGIMDAMRRKDFAAVTKYPFIVRVIKGYTNNRPPIPKEVRARVLSIGYCVRCGSTKKLEVDHIIPYSRGGAHDESNFQCLCKKCNCIKHDKLESEL